MLAPNTTLRNRYQIVRQLGQGGMGAVYLATDQTFGSTVALKETLISDEHLRKAFEREARLLNRLRHAGLPHVFDYFFEGDGQFLVMQFIPGEDLGQQLKRYQRAFAPDDVLKWADQLLDLLDYLHTHEPPIIHRDIKPENLKLTQRGDIILLDFGLAKGSTDQMTQVSSKSLFGYTPHYAPFEQIQGQGTDPRSDLFALAATLYHLLTAKLPPDAMVRALTTMNGQADPLEPAHVVNPAVPEALGAVLHQAMAMGRDQRPQSAAAMRATLAGLRDDSVAPLASAAPSPADAVTVAVPPSSSASLVVAVPARRRAWLAAAGVAVAVVSIGLVVAAPGQRPGSAVAVPREAAPADVDLAPITIAPAERTFAFRSASVAAGGAVTQTDRQARSYLEDLGKGVAIEMIAIPGGEFLMGTASAEYPDEGPPHTVKIRPFYLSRHEVTQAQWRAVAALPRVARALDPDPSAFKGDDLPVEQVSWLDAMEFCERLSRKTRHVYHLPSEAEWEYAARAGTTTHFAFGDALAPTLASYDATVPFAGGARGPAPTSTSKVGSFGVANAFGLSDMHGNVSEWCLGEYHASYEGAPGDNRPWMAGGDTDRHVLRGGSWDDLAVDCRSANRYSYPREGRRQTIGFRLAMSLTQPAMSAAAPTPAIAAAEPGALLPNDTRADRRGSR